jgi:ELWxxDGT repeat protein
VPRLYYAAPNASGDYVIWTTDGTTVGTHSIFTGTQNYGAQSPYGFATLGDDDIFAAADPTGFVGVWVTKGAGASTIELIFGKQGTALLGPQQFSTVGSQVVFEARDSNNNEALWSTGPASGEAQILLEFDKPRYSYTSFGDFAIAADADVSGNAELWVTDGTAAETSLFYSSASSSDFDDNFNLAQVGDYALFEARDSTGAVGLFSVDGATGGYVELMLGKQGLYALQPSALTVAGYRAFYSAYTPSTPRPEIVWGR